jgi:hypothetical protein
MTQMTNERSLLMENMGLSSRLHAIRCREEILSFIMFRNVYLCDEAHVSAETDCIAITNNLQYWH